MSGRCTRGPQSARSCCLAPARQKLDWWCDDDGGLGNDWGYLAPDGSWLAEPAYSFAIWMSAADVFLVTVPEEE